MQMGLSGGGGRDCLWNQTINLNVQSSRAGNNYDAWYFLEVVKTAEKPVWYARIWSFRIKLTNHKSLSWSCIQTWVKRSHQITHGKVFVIKPLLQSNTLRSSVFTKSSVYNLNKSKERVNWNNRFQHSIFFYFV